MVKKINGTGVEKVVDAEPKKAEPKKQVEFKEDKKLGEMANKWMGEFPLSHLSYIPSGSIVLDYLWGKGLPLGKMFGLFSTYGLGKSTILLSLMRGILANDRTGVVIYIDSEGGVTKDILANMGFLCDDWKQLVLDDPEVPLTKLLRPEFRGRLVLVVTYTYEDAEKVINAYADTGRLRMVGIDSASSLQPEKVIEEDSHQIGIKATTDQKFFQGLKRSANINRFMVLGILQEQPVVNIGGHSNGPKVKAKASQGFMFVCDGVFHMFPQNFIYNNKRDKVGVCAKIYNPDKNRLTGNRSASIFLRYGYGISNIATLSSMVKWAGMAVVRGAYYDLKLEGLDLGEGVGKPVACLGNNGLEEKIADHLAEILEVLETSGKRDEYFEKYVAAK